MSFMSFFFFWVWLPLVFLYVFILIPSPNFLIVIEKIHSRPEPFSGGGKPQTGAGRVELFHPVN